ncbi:SUMF1/EgtB/PvdO family nonheme iron enzyme [Endothiovibrio diazotrophicus]
MGNPDQRGRVQQGRNRVLRGGSWANHGRNLRSAQRNGNPPDNRNDNIGFRLAGALWAGGSINQRAVPFRSADPRVGRSPGLRCVSRRQGEPLRAESLPVGRLFPVVP